MRVCKFEREKEALFALGESRVLFLIASRCRRCKGTLSLPQKTLSSPIKAITLSPCRDNGRMESSTHLCIPQCISIPTVLFLQGVFFPSKELLNTPVMFSIHFNRRSILSLIFHFIIKLNYVQKDLFSYCVSN